MFENLSNKLNRAFKVLKGQGKITEVNVASTVKEIRRALIDADVSYKIAKEEFSDVYNGLTTIMQEVHDLEAELEKGKAPFTPGRLPAWKND